MKPLTMQQAVETTGWSQRMLRYLEQAGLVTALRSAGGHRLYGRRAHDRRACRERALVAGGTVAGRQAEPEAQVAGHAVEIAEAERPGDG